MKDGGKAGGAVSNEDDLLDVLREMVAVDLLLGTSHGPFVLETVICEQHDELDLLDLPRVQTKGIKIREAGKVG